MNYDEFDTQRLTMTSVTTLMTSHNAEGTMNYDEQLKQINICGIGPLRVYSAPSLAANTP